MGCMDEQRVLFSSFLMEDRAKDWWDAVERRYPDGITRDGNGPGESGYSSKPAPFGPGMDYTYWSVDVYGDTHINPRGDGGGDGLTLTPAPYPPRPRYSLNK